ncbi:MAG TPA: ABC transporter permease [Chitinophagaceae bacterium]|nr:ABC transporter permease [Chitinophagaceae bacterium]
MTIGDSFALAFRTVRGNKLRTGITVTIIAFGIMALIGIITAIQAMNGKLRESFSFMGANAFTVSYKERFRFGNNNNSTEKIDKTKKQKKSNLDKVIRLQEAELFKDNFKYPAVVSISLSGPGGVEVHYEQKKTNPNVRITGGDENYLEVNAYKIEAGRNLNKLDVRSGRNVCLLGSDVADKLFGPQRDRAVDKIVRVGGVPYLVVGVLQSKGSSALLRADNIIITTYNNVRKLDNASTSFTIGVMAQDVQQLDGAVTETTALFRAIRKLQPTEEDNFAIDKSDKLAETFIGLLGSITFAAAAIGIITLIGAAIGLMNIMLVAVNERTREVGLIKAIGGKKRNIRAQFLFESTIISLMGALFGIFLGVLVGNVFSLVLGTGFVVPWGWVISGIIICSFVGLAAGLGPAVKASKLNPIVALRYE